MIGRWALEETARLLGAVKHEGDVAFNRVCTDSRLLEPGDLFVALVGERFDGHQFASEAMASGAAAILTSRWLEGIGPQLLVEDTLMALGQLGAINRQRFQGGVIAVTGSSGKTSVKEMCAEILSVSGSVHATRGNFNNAIGVPLTLLALPSETDNAVIELGASAEGEIAYTTHLAAPDVAVLNNAGGAHLEGFGSLEGVVRAKGEIFQGLAEDGIAVINLDDPHAPVWLKQVKGRQLHRFSVRSPEADFFASHCERRADGCFSFVLNTHRAQVDVALNVMGEHAVANALASAAATFGLGVPLDQIAVGLNRFRSVPGRLMPLRGQQGARLVDDSYNANPESVRAAIRVLGSLPGRRTLVLGNMAELGLQSAELHKQLGLFARDVGIERLLAVGDLAAQAASAFGDNGIAVADCDAAVELLMDELSENDAILVKGSRSAKMERVIKALTDKGSA